MRLANYVLLAVPVIGVPTATELVLGGPPAFTTQINECMELFAGADPETKALVDLVRQPAPSPRHTIQQGAVGAGAWANTDPVDASQAHLQPGGGPGTGSGTTITLDPTISADSLCAFLIHELQHAANMQRGIERNTQRPRPQPGAGIPEEEIDAYREENRYRAHAGLPQARTVPVDTPSGTVDTPLPPDAVF